MSNLNKFTLTLTEWENHINHKKQKILKNININNVLDTTNENVKFINIIKSLMKSRLFTISNIAFLFIKMLETTYIKPSIILHSVGIYYKDVYMNNVSNMIDESVNNTSDLVLESLLKLVVDLVVYFEIIININCLIIIKFLQNIYISSRQPKIFNRFQKLNNEAERSIKPSTLILLCLKFIRKIGVFKIEDKLIKLINDDPDDKNDTKRKLNIKLQKMQNDVRIKMRQMLDTFMLKIDSFFEIDKDDRIEIDEFDDKNNIYKICIFYITALIELFLNNFNILFEVLELYIIKDISNNDVSSNNELPNKIQKLKYMKNTINNLLDVEFDDMKNLFVLQ
uniref:Uncharacterized protein n=1 Tax=viral metagenome TaxID=1070528 RepID=A0A6C0EYF6_9ZZZZ